jgi:hypothetical protein
MLVDLVSNVVELLGILKRILNAKYEFEIEETENIFSLEIILRLKFPRTEIIYSYSMPRL